MLMAYLLSGPNFPVYSYVPAKDIKPTMGDEFHITVITCV